MRSSERIVAGALFSAVLLLAPGFLLHQAPRFPGSLPGSALGIGAAILFLLLLLYSPVRRFATLRRRVALGPLLTFHVFGGVLGALLGILHSGHAYRSALGIALVATMLGVVATGFVGRYYLSHVAGELRDQEATLLDFRSQLGRSREAGDQSGTRRLIGSIADLEWSITRRAALQRAMSGWTIAHILLAIAMYALLALHVWSALYYGLRWLR